MLVGIVMSFKELTQFHIRDWCTAPWSGLDNYRVAVDFDSAVGEALLHSFGVTVRFTLLSVGLSLAARHRGGGLMQDAFRGRATAAHAVPDAVRAAGLRGGHHLELHVPAGQRPGEPRAASTSCT